MSRQLGYGVQHTTQDQKRYEYKMMMEFKFCILRKMDVLEPDLISVPKKEKRTIQYLTQQEYEEN